MKTLFVALILALLGSGAHAASSPRPLTVADSIEATRVWYDKGFRNAVRFSPDGHRYLVLLFRGDLKKDGNWVEFLTGTTDSLESAARPRIVARLFTREFDVLQFLFRTPFVWLADNERVAFPWNPDRDVGQILIVNLRTGDLKKLVTSNTRISSMHISPDGRTVVYTAYPDGAATRMVFERMVKKGFTITDDQSLSSLLGGYPSRRALERYAEQVFVKTSAFESPRRMPLDRYVTLWASPVVSPDGHWAVIVARPREIPRHWSLYTHPSLKLDLVNEREHPAEPSASGQLWLIDTEQLKATPLWDAPAFSSGIWSPDSKSIVLSRAFLPVHKADAAGLAGTAVAEVSVTGEVTPIRVPGSTEVFIAERWLEDGQLELRSARGGATVLMRKIGHEWKVSHGHAKTSSGAEPSRIRIEVRQSLNTPPTLVAVDPSTGKEAPIRDVEPRLADRFILGHVEVLRWKDSAGRSWKGRLYYPAQYEATQRYPLVIQYAPWRATPEGSFSLRGSELHSCVLSTAQPLAGRGMFVLTAIGGPEEGVPKPNTPEEFSVRQDGIESAVRHLVSIGLADPTRVGLGGFSRFGAYIMYILTHSDFSFAAAIAADNVNHGYVNSLLFPLEEAEATEIYGAPPRDGGLMRWIRNAPTFNTHKILAPLLLERDSGGIDSLLLQWEFYANLRRLGKPVELYVAPDIQARGSHGFVLPSQQLASMEQAVDWFDFWLNGQEDPDTAKIEQYLRWRRLREQVPGRGRSQ